MTDFKRENVVPQFLAGAKKPYGSRTLRALVLLAHKVVHTFCEKALAAQAWKTSAGSCLLLEHGAISQWNQRLRIRTWPLLTILSTKGVQKAGAELNRRAKEHDTSRIFVVFSTKSSPALFLRKEKICI